MKEIFQRCFPSMTGQTLRAFTLLELLLVIAIIASLAGLIINALNPAERLSDVNDAKTESTANDIEKAIEIYIVENGGNLPAGLNSVTETGIYDICKTGETIGCINLDILTPEYLQSIPVDVRYETTHTSGYKIEFNTTNKEVQVYSESEYEEATEYCPPGDICNSPVAEWLFDEGNGNTAIDTSGNDNNGTLTNGPIWIEGYKNGAIQFDGTDDYIIVSQPGIQTNPNRFTISGWINPSAATRRFLSPRSAGYDQYINYNHTSSRIEISIAEATDTNTRTRSSTNGSVPIDQWTHWSITLDDKILRIYINGKLDAEYIEIINIANWSSDWVIGARGNYSGFYNGILDDLKIYNYIRTPAQVAWEYNHGAPIAHWEFDEGTGTTTADSSGNNSNGTLVNGPTWITGKYGNALDFDGIDDYVSVGVNNFDSINFTVMGWIYIRSSIPTYNQIIGTWSGSGSEQAWGIGTNWDNVCPDNPRSIYFQLYGSGLGNSRVRRTPDNSINYNQWHHIAAVRQSATEQVIYIDGIKQDLISCNSGGTPGDVTHSTRAVELGARDAGQDSKVDGILDDFRIYNYALTSSQVMQAMHERSN